MQYSSELIQTMRQALETVMASVPADQSVFGLKAAVAEHVLSGRGNPDGIHWNFEAHQAVAELMLKALAQAGIDAEKPRG